MASLREEAARLQFLMEKGHGDEKVHVVFVEREAAERIANEAKGIKKAKTRFQWETDTPEGYSLLNAAKDRLIRILVNKQIAISIAARLWLDVEESVLRQMAEDGDDAANPSLGEA